MFEHWVRNKKEKSVLRKNALLINILKRLLLVVLIVSINSLLNAATKTWNVAGGGAWNNGANWIGGLPVGNDDVIINPGSAFIITNVPTIALNSLTIGGNNTVTLTGAAAVTITINNSGAANDLYINTGSLTLSTNVRINMATGSYALVNSGRTFTLSVATNTFTLTGTAILEVAGTLTHTAGTLAYSNTSTVNYSGGAQTVASVNYGNLTLSGSGAKTLQAGTATINGGLTTSGTATASTVANLAVSGDLTVGTGSGFTVGANFTLGVTGNSAITGSLTLAGTGAKTFTGDVTINSGGVWNETGIAAINYAGNLQNDGTTFTANTGVHTFSGTTKTISGASIVAIPSLTISGTTTNNGTLTVSTTLAGGSTLTNGATGILNFGGASITPTLTATAVGNTVNYTGTGQTLKVTAYHHLTLSGGAETFGAITTIAGNLALSGTATATTGAALAITGNLNIGNGSTFTVGAFTLSVGGTTTVGGGTSGTLSFSSATNPAKTFTGLVTINAGANWTESAAITPTFNNGITNSGTFTASTGAHTFDTNSQALTGTFSIPSVTVTGAPIVLTNNNSLTVGTALAGTGGLTNATNSTLNINFIGALGINTLTATASGNTVNYGGAAQTVKVTTYTNLTLSGSGTKTLGGSISIAGDLSITGCIFDLGANTANRASAGGNLNINAAGTLSIGGTNSFPSNYSALNFNATSTVEYSGADQVIPVLSYQNLTISGTGTKTLAGSITPAGNLTISSSILDLGSTYTVNRASSGGTLSIGATGTLTIGGTNTFPSNYTTNTCTAGSTVIYNGTDQTVAATFNYSNLTLSGSGTKTLTAGAARTANALTVNPNVILLLDGTFSFTATSAAIDGTVKVSGITASLAGAPVFNNGSIYEHARNGGPIPTSTWNTGSTCLVTGITNTLPTGLNQPAPSFYNFTWNCSGHAGSLNFGGNLSSVQNNFTIQSTGSGNILLLPTTGQSITIGGALSISGGTLYPKNSAGTSTINLSGDFSVTGGSIMNTTGAVNIIFQKAGTQIFTKSGSGTISGNVNFTVNSGSILDMGTSVADGGGTFTLSSGATLATANTNGIASAGATGSVQTTTRSFSSGANYLYNAAGNQITGVFTTTPTAATVNNLTISGGGSKTLSSATSVAGTLTLNSGVLLLGSNNLTIANTSNTAIAGTYSNTSMIETSGSGSLIKNGAVVGDFQMVYPIGTVSPTAVYAPVQINSLSSSGVTNPGSVTVRTIASAPLGLVSTNILNRYWITSSTNITSPIASIQFGFDASDVPSSANLIDLSIYYNPNPPGTAWLVPPGASTQGVNPIFSTASTTLSASWTAASKSVFYSLVNGDWDDWNTWTFDPSGSLPNNPNHYTPSSSLTSAADEVVILSGKTVTIQPGNNNKTNSKLTVYGNLNVTTTTNHTFTYINGTGRIQMGADNFPGGDASNFLANGTAVLAGTSHTMTTARTFKNVEVNMTNSTDIVALAANYTINNDLTIVNGKLQLNDNASTTALSFIIKGTTNVSSGAGFTVGTGHATHRIEFQGDVTNNGTIDFANDAQYACEATGAVKVYFTGAADNTLVCSGITDLYRMFVDKGSDDTYTLSVISSSTADFNLFGPISGGTCIDPADGSGGWQRLALVLVNGTLKLGSNITIPNLGDNRTGVAPNEFSIPTNGRLWINGASATTYNTGGTNRGITIYGTLQVSSGSFTNPDNSGGITYFSTSGSPAKLFIENGSVYTTQLKQGDGSARLTYIQTGGLFNINNLSNSRGSGAIFSMPASDFVFLMSGGLIQIDAVNTAATNGIYIACDPSNASVTNGTIDIRTPTLDATGQPSFYINSTVPFYNLSLTNSVRAGPQSVVLQSAITVQNDLTIGASTTLNTNNFDVTVGGNMSVLGTYTPGTNTTTFKGAGSNTFTVNGTINPSLNNMTLNKTNTLTLAGTGTFTVAGNLTLTSGTLEDGGKTLTVNKNISNSATHTSVGGGRIVLSGGGSQHTLSGSGSGKFGNIQLNEANGAVITADQIINGTLTMTSGIFDLGINKLTVATLSPNNISSYSASLMFRLSGYDSDDGLVRPVSGTGAVYFPIGTNSGGTNRYTPSIATVLTVTSSGALQMNVGDKVLPSLNSPSGTNQLTYYWKVRRNGLAGTATYQFTADIFDDDDGAGFVGSDRKGFVLNESPYSRTNDGAPAGLTFTVNTYPIYNASYTVAKVNNFTGTPDVFYSNVSGTDWNTGAIWHQGSKAGGTGTVPTAGSIVIIYSDAVGQGRMAVNTGTSIPNIPAEITFEQNNATSTTENLPRLQFFSGGTFNLGNVKGAGMISFGASGITVNGDFGDFGTNDKSYYLFFDNGGAPNPITAIPNPIPNLMVEYSTSINKAITVNSDFIVQGNATVTPLQNVTINRDLLIGYWVGGIFQFPGSVTPVTPAITVTVGRNIDFTQDPLGNLGTSRSITVQAATSAIEHRLIVKGNIIRGSSAITAFDLYNSATQTNAILELSGSGTHSYTGTTTTPVADFYRLIMNKGTDQTSTFTFNRNFTLGGTSNLATKALQLSNGTLILNGPFNIPLTTGGAAFNIPSTAGLEIQAGTVTASGGSGITLDGKLNISGGTVDMSGLAGQDNYIEYSASGNANIIISNGSLIVGSQLRRSKLVSDGSLKYNQSGGTVALGKSAAPTGYRGVFEVLNIGSDFTFTGGTLTITRTQDAPISMAAFYLDPATSSIGSGTVIIGDANTPASQTIGVYSSVPLQTLTVNSTNSPIAKMWTGALTLNGDLIISTGAGFNANGLDLILKGNLTITGSGTFTPSGNTTYFSGLTAQTITGNATLYNLTKTGSNDLNLATGAATLNVSNNLTIQAGTLTDNSNNIYVGGTLNIDGTHVYGGSNNGITMNGTVAQTLLGSGTLGKLTINNTNGVSSPLLSNYISIENALRLQNGIFTIGKNLLTLNVNATIEAGSAFSSSNMIQTNISSFDRGVKKILPAVTSPPAPAINFTYPMGSGGKYTPVAFTITANDNNPSGSITVKVANERHPSILENPEVPGPEIVDSANVLQYYWVLRSSGITGFSAVANMTYYPVDVKVTSPYAVTDYITARLLNDGSGNWNKFNDVNTFDETNRWAQFTFGGVDDASISGDYTAGINSAIPTQVPLYETTTTGNWTTDDIWSPSITGGPRGSLTRINTGHTANVTVNYLSDYTTIINGTAKLYSTFGHRFGDVSGTGTLYLERDAIPAGDYSVFFSSAGGTLEYGGTALDYDILGGIALVNNLTLSGSGRRNMPNDNVVLNGSLNINGADVYAYAGKEINLKGNLRRTGGTFNAGTGTTSVKFSSTVNQTITGNFTGSNSLNILKVDNPNGITLAGNVKVNSQITLTKGVVTTGANTLTLGLTGTITPSPGTLTAYINGILEKELTPGSNFVYPIGKSANLGPIEVTGIGGFTGTAGWKAEYFNVYSLSMDPQYYEPALNYVSHFEYWSLQSSAAGSTGNIKITLDGSSDIANGVSATSDIRIVGWNTANSRWEIIGGVPTMTGTRTAGSINSSSAINFDSYRYITLGSITPITAGTATITSGSVSICSGSSTNIMINFTGPTPYTLDYTIGGVPQTQISTSVNPYPLNTGPLVANKTYSITAMSANAVPGSVLGTTSVTITVLAVPALTLSPASYSICEGTSVTYTASTSFSNYEFFNGVTSLQNGSVRTYTSSTIANGDNITVVATTATGCSKTSNAVPNTVSPMPTAPTGKDTIRCGTGTVSLEGSGAGAGESYRWYALYSGGTVQGTGSPWTTPSIAASTSYYLSKYNTTSLCESSPRVTVKATVVAQPSAPGLTPNPNLASVCTGQTITVTTSAGAGGTGIITDEYRNTSDGSTWTLWGSSVPSFAAGTNTNYIESRRRATGAGCTTSASNQVNWVVNIQPVASTLTKNPNTATVADGNNVSASLNVAGSGGAGCSDIYEYRTNGGAWSNYNFNDPINSAGLTSIDIRSTRGNCSVGAGCTDATNTYSWTVTTVPDAAGPITGTATLCQGATGVGYSVGAITGATSYVWTYSVAGVTTIYNGTTNSITIDYANNATSGNLTVSGHNASGDGPSSSLSITVNPLPVSGPMYRLPNQ